VTAGGVERRLRAALLAYYGFMRLFPLLLAGRR
jgi:hypothetical protein